MDKTFEKGDCCMLTLLAPGHARMDLSEDVNHFDDEDHMNHVGEYVFQVNETCLGGDHRTFLIAPTDKLKVARKERRKETYKANKRKSYESQDYGRGYYGQHSTSSSTWRPKNR